MYISMVFLNIEAISHLFLFSLILADFMMANIYVIPCSGVYMNCMNVFYPESSCNVEKKLPHNIRCLRLDKMNINASI